MRDVRTQYETAPHPPPHARRVRFIRQAGNVEAAIRSYRAAVSYMPTYADAYYNLGIALKSLGEVCSAASPV